MCRLRNIAMRDYQESVTTGQTHGQTNRQTDGQTDAGQSDPYVPLCFAGDTKNKWYNVFSALSLKNRLPMFQIRYLLMGLNLISIS